MRIYKVSNVCIITHRLADVDAYCSAYALAYLLRSKGVKSIDVIFPEGLNLLANKVKEHYDISLNANLHYEYNHDVLKGLEGGLVIILDTSNPALLADAYRLMVEGRCRKVIIDHHPPSEDARGMADEVIIDTEASSTCELVYRIFKARRVKINSDVAGALLLGILTDTQHLTIARCKSLEVVSRLCRVASIEHARGILALDRDYSEKVARLKAAQRCILYKVNGFIVALSSIGSYHASAAKALLDLGADLAIVTGSDGKSARASLRATQVFHTKTGIHLGTDILARISSAGGGHATAASISLECSEDELSRRIMGLLRDMIGRLDPI